jgi:hypothetical protein
MANFDSHEQDSLGSAIVSQKSAFNGADLLFGDRPIAFAGRAAADYRTPAQNQDTATGLATHRIDAPATVKTVSADTSLILDSASSDKIKGSLEDPHVSDTSISANKVFEPIARLGASAFWLHKDAVSRAAAIESTIANTPLVTRPTFLQYELARENLMNGLRIPIAQSEAALETLYSKYPQDIMHSNAFPKIGGAGVVSVPHEVDLVHLSPADRQIAHRYTNLNSLRESLIHNWPPGSSSTSVLPRDIGAKAFMQAENLTDVATKFDQAGIKYADEAAQTVENNKALRFAKGSYVLKSGATLGAAWLTNAGIDAVFNPKVGPSYLTWTADIVSPAVLLTNKSMLVKFGVVTGAHVAAKVYDQINDK